MYLRLSNDPMDNVATGAGFGSVGVRLRFEPETPGDPLAAAVTSTASIARGPVWASASPGPVTATTAGLEVYSDNASGVLLLVGDRVLLGTFTLDATQSGAVTLTAEVFDPTNLTFTTSYDSTYFYDGVTTSAGATLTVSPVPEPGGLLIAAAAVGCTVRMRRLSGREPVGRLT